MIWIRYLPHILGGIGLSVLLTWGVAKIRADAREPLEREILSLRTELSMTIAQHRQASEQAKAAGERYAADVTSREERWAEKAKQDEDAMVAFEAELARTRSSFDARLRSATAKARNTLCRNPVQVPANPPAQAGTSEGSGLLGQEADRRLREFERQLGEIRDEAMRESQKLHSCQQRYWAIEAELEAFRQGIAR